ncbi:MAG TPA: phosphoribosylformylglycinamidine cyclo-ligase, partial [Thermoplasmatales archaeon]|nr:phosphoribosylformylglycinamidine cyclo-ligase [Thermoplasmatales archaeon]
MTYAESGVDIYKEEEAISNLLSQIKTKRKGIGKPLGGHYAGMIEFGEYALVLCTDGVGSKVLIASSLKKWDTIGIDCIAMNVNDAICVGAEPLAFVDYIAIDDPKPEILREIGRGLEIGARESNISIIGGETASLPELIKGFDLAGTCLSYVKKERIITGEKIQPGDIIIGLKSNGLHSNGYTLARKIIEKQGFRYTDYFPDDLYPGETIGEILLKPTEIYVKPILSVLDKIEVKGLAHITGGGMRNLLRLNENVAFILDDLFEPQPIFSFLQEKGNVDLKEMYQTFNMGTGFMIIASEENHRETLEILKKSSNIDIKTVGYIERGRGVHI